MAIHRLVRPALLLSGGALTLVMTAACQGNVNATGNWSDNPTTSGVATGQTAPAATTTAVPTTARTTPAASGTGGGNGSGTAGPVYVELPFTSKSGKPNTLGFYEHTELDGISWSGWGGSTASGTGTLTDDDCTPDCATGHQDTYSAHVVLSDIRTVNGTREYTRYTVTFTGQAQHPELARSLTDQAAHS